MKQEELQEYREEFIEYMDRVSLCGTEHAKMECEAHIENVGIDDLSDPSDDADECMSYWEE